MFLTKFEDRHKYAPDRLGIAPGVVVEQFAKCAIRSLSCGVYQIGCERANGPRQRYTYVDDGLLAMQCRMAIMYAYYDCTLFHTRPR